MGAYASPTRAQRREPIRKILEVCTWQVVDGGDQLIRDNAAFPGPEIPVLVVFGSRILFWFRGSTGDLIRPISPPVSPKSQIYAHF